MKNPGVTTGGTWKERTTASVIRLMIWTAGWLATLALAAFGPAMLWDARWLTLLAILTNLAFGLAMMGANIAHLKVLDELMQKVQLEAMGLSLGIGVVAGLSYSLLDTSDLIAFQAEIGHLVLLIGITYLASSILGVRRYR